MYTLKSNNTTRPPKPRKQLILIIAAATLIVLGVLFVVLEKTDTIDLIHKSKKADPVLADGPANSSADSSKGESQNPDNDDTSRPEDEKPQGNTADPNTPLVAPTGSFVSNHKPKLSDPGRVAMQSTCTTTSGATCEIIFTKGTETKSLGAQNTDREGSVYWSWNAKDLGLSPGTWHIQAKAVLGSQTKTADDATNLEVEP